MTWPLACILVATLLGQLCAGEFVGVGCDFTVIWQQLLHFDAKATSLHVSVLTSAACGFIVRGALG
jgi:hypothetical protein